MDRWELYPNMCNSFDSPWHTVKEEMANKNKELTSLWMVGPKNRKLAIESGVYKWTDKNCRPDILGINGIKSGKILSAIIDINQSNKRLISPKYVTNNIGSWKQQGTIEFFVDFETSNGSLSDIKRLPTANTETIVCTIGVGYIDPSTEKWVHKDFSVNRLTFAEEVKICTKFAKFIRNKAKQYKVKTPNCIHWSSAEEIIWSDVMDRHESISDEWKSWTWNWLDLLVVFKEEPIVINGCMNFGLKSIAAAMRKHGFIKTGWNKSSSCTDGRSAMVAAYKAHNLACETNVSMKAIPAMHLRARLRTLRCIKSLR